MTAPIINDGTNDRPMTDDELANYKIVVAEVNATEAAAKAKEQARAAVCAKLGLTADEAAALLG